MRSLYKVLLLFFIPILLYARTNPFSDIKIEPDLIEDNSISLLNIDSSSNNSDKRSVIDKKISSKVTSLKVIKIKVKKIDKKQKIEKFTAPSTTIQKTDEPIIITDENAKYILDCCKITKKRSTIKKRRSKVKKKIYRYKTIYKNYFLTIKSDQRSVKIFTKDCLISKKVSYNPTRLILDFRRVEYFKSVKKWLNFKTIKNIKIGSHHCFYRIVIEFKKGHKIVLSKKSYGYLIH